MSKTKTGAPKQHEMHS